MKLPDPNEPIHGGRFVIVAGIICILFTVIMGLGTYGLATVWAHLHKSPPTSPAK